MSPESVFWISKRHRGFDCPKCLCPEIEMPRWTGVASISECAIAWLFLLQLCKSLKGQQNLLDVFLTELCGLCILYLFVSCLSADLKPIRMPSQKSIEASANAQGKQRNIKHLLAGSETKLFSDQRLRFHAMLHVKLRNVAGFSTLAESAASGLNH